MTDINDFVTRTLQTAKELKSEFEAQGVLLSLTKCVELATIADLQYSIDMVCGILEVDVLARLGEIKEAIEPDPPF